jgi:hypothetical protein
MTIGIAAVLLVALTACGPKNRKAKHGSGEAEETSSSSGDSKNDHFDTQVEKARVIAPQLSKGAVIVLRFFNPSNNFRASMAFVDKDYPEKKESGRHLVLAEAHGDNDALLATITILHRNWQPGTYQCNEDTMIAFGLNEHWDPTAPDTYLSASPGSSCSIVLQEGKAPGDLEGSIRGVFNTNNGTHKLVIQDGYIYVKQFM